MDPLQVTEALLTNVENTAAIDARGFVSGLIDFENAGRLKEAGEALINNAENELSFDLDGINAANSVTIALLVGWWRCAQWQEIGISFTGVPVKLKAIIKLCGLDEVLPVNNS